MLEWWPFLFLNTQPQPQLSHAFSEHNIRTGTLVYWVFSLMIMFLCFWILAIKRTFVIRISDWSLQLHTMTMAQQWRAFRSSDLVHQIFPSQHLQAVGTAFSIEVSLAHSSLAQFYNVVRQHINGDMYDILCSFFFLLRQLHLACISILSLFLIQGQILETS